MEDKFYFVAEYQAVPDPTKQEKAKNWDVAIGLQMVDGLKPSKYLYKVARDNIEGKIDHDTVHDTLRRYYQTVDGQKEKLGTEEADLVSNRIAELLGHQQSFVFSPSMLMSIHKYLFKDVLQSDWVGVFRKQDITKKEDVLNGDTVPYASFLTISDILEYYFDREKNVDYTVLDKVEQSHKLADFISRIWQIHPFREGNTRTVAVFTIKYLRSKGFVVDNTLFKDNSEYFRNALVRANYENVGKGIRRTTEYLYKFFDNLLLSTEYDLDTVTKVGEC